MLLFSLYLHLKVRLNFNVKVDFMQMMNGLRGCGKAAVLPVACARSLLWWVLLFLRKTLEANFLDFLCRGLGCSHLSCETWGGLVWLGGHSCELWTGAAPAPKGQGLKLLDLPLNNLFLVAAPLVAKETILLPNLPCFWFQPRLLRPRSFVTSFADLKKKFGPDSHSFKPFVFPAALRPRRRLLEEALLWRVWGSASPQHLPVAWTLPSAWSWIFLLV